LREEVVGGTHGRRADKPRLRQAHDETHPHENVRLSRGCSRPHRGRRRRRTSAAEQPTAPRGPTPLALAAATQRAPRVPAPGPAALAGRVLALVRLVAYAVTHRPQRAENREQMRAAAICMRDAGQARAASSAWSRCSAGRRCCAYRCHARGPPRPERKQRHMAER
jgi:hypothetical protein